MSKSMRFRSSVLVPNLSVGIDLGADASVACLLDRAGKVVKTEAFSMSPDVVREMFGRDEPVTIVLEACNQAAWVSRLLEELGHVVLVCNPRRLKLIACSTLKTDKLDAEILARLARLSQMDPALVQGTTVRSRSTQLVRSQLRGREQLVKARTALISFVRSTLRADALPLHSCESKRFASKIDPSTLPADTWSVIEHPVAMIQELTMRIEAIEMSLQQAAKERPEVQHLQEIDGIGLLTSLSFVLCIEDPTRFARSRDVGPYLGLVPVVRSSSTEERRGRITKAGDGGVRRLLVQAAQSMLRSKRESALKRFALRIEERRGRKKAVVALARKLAVVMHRVWVSGEDYVRFPDEQLGKAA